MDIKLLVLYFVIGGAAVAATTWFGSQGKGLLAAFVGVFPSVTVITIISIYFSSGTSTTLSYLKGMLILMPPWLLYIACVIFLLPRIGLGWSLTAGIAIYMVTALIVIKFTPSG
ncbi:MAG: DUF3147 domain-containing protein [Dehalococcoidia bacterium]|nr:DUF3147 domain-containing protein [Dehalococcoidia bacterium]